MNMTAKEYKKKIENYNKEEIDYELRKTIAYLEIAANEKKESYLFKKKIIEEVLNFDIEDDNFIFIDNENLKIIEESEEFNSLSLEDLKKMKS